MRTAPSLSLLLKSLSLLLFLLSTSSPASASPQVFDLIPEFQKFVKMEQDAGRQEDGLGPARMFSNKARIILKMMQVRNYLKQEPY